MWSNKLEGIKRTLPDSPEDGGTAPDGEPHDPDRRHAATRTRTRLDVLRLQYLTDGTEDLEYTFLSRVRFLPSVAGEGQQLHLYFSEWQVTVTGYRLGPLRDQLAARQCGRLVENPDPMGRSETEPVVTKIELKERR